MKIVDWICDHFVAGVMVLWVLRVAYGVMFEETLVAVRGSYYCEKCKQRTDGLSFVCGYCHKTVCSDCVEECFDRHYDDVKGLPTKWIKVHKDKKRN